MLGLTTVLLLGKLLSTHACIPTYEFDGTVLSCLGYGWGYTYVQNAKHNQCAILGNTFGDHCDEKYRTCVRLCDNSDQCIFPYFNEVKRQKCVAAYEDNTECNYGQAPRVIAPRYTKFCQCEQNADCFNELMCKQGVCVCENDSNCGTAQLCVHGPFSWNALSVTNGLRPIGKPNGECACNVYDPVTSCNNNGVCVRRNPDNTNAAHPTVLPVPHGSPHRHHGMCRCYKGWGGEFCERNLSRETRCNNRGRPLCRAPYTKQTDLNVKSLFTNQELGLGECDFAKGGFADTAGEFPGDSGCQCDRGFGPDIAASVQEQCRSEISCATPGGDVLGVVATDSYCRCFGDFYQSKLDATGLQVNPPGRCLPNCRRNICSNHGKCTPNEESGNTFNEKCTCDTGWRTSDFTTQTLNSLRFNFEVQRYCDQPEQIVGGSAVVCGVYGQANKDITSNFCELKPEFRSIANEFKINSASGLYIRICPVLQTGSLKGLECGGEQFGRCVSDGYNGHKCVCNNGFAGTSQFFTLRLGFFT